VEAEDLDLAYQVAQPPVGDALAAVLEQAVANGREIPQELRRVGVSCRGRVRVESAPEAFGHEQVLPPVDLVRVDATEAFGDLRHLRLVPPYRTA
jgi:hypothetical protein